MTLETSAEPSKLLPLHQFASAELVAMVTGLGSKAVLVIKLIRVFNDPENEPVM